MIVDRGYALRGKSDEEAPHYVVVKKGQRGGGAQYSAANAIGNGVDAAGKTMPPPTKTPPQESPKESPRERATSKPGFWRNPDLKPPPAGRSLKLGR